VAVVRPLWEWPIWLCIYLWYAIVFLLKMTWKLVVLICTFSFPEVIVPALPWVIDYLMTLILLPPPVLLNQKVAVSAMMFPLVGLIRADSAIQTRNPSSASFKFLRGSRIVLLAAGLGGAVLYAMSVTLKLLRPPDLIRQENLCYKICAWGLAIALVLSFINFALIRRKEINPVKGR